ncbi:MAG: sn-glycerol-3-phosphate dehydrogenase subunit C [Anaerolineae bacterium UTCFX2]|jgi:glycerol-3-phosphate dehydrogenase subunit C|nr:anaerobic glycerol-3-phosphate dehydrogenase subunit C [Anaerolineae bacterium]MCZ7553835.1 anaerobic glycerol-3-phosphate dehydrogenase subunit C [Anaerolineales bacterium]OQY89665.1 MAG: sn-glycerol-3-phosphate dehydrogenase subunit C [Anaerolineae bacterium UTCFX2]
MKEGLFPPPVEMTLDQCIKCNICTSVCPVSAVTDLFPGPKYAAPQAGRFRQPGQPNPDASVDYCDGCRVCNLACPTGVKIAEMNARARAVMVEQGAFNLVLRLRNNLLARPELLGKAARPIAPAANYLLNLPAARLLADKVFGVAREAPLPAFSSDTFTAWFKNHARRAPALPGRKVVYFHGCSTQYYERRIGVAAVQVLEHLGFEVIVPRQNCCGLPLLSNGEFAAARRYHRSNVANLVEFARAGIPIVGTSTSCTLTLKEEAPELLDMHDEDSALVAKSTYDFNEFLLLLHAEGLLNLELASVNLRLLYHIPCQYRAHRLGHLGSELLGLIPGLEIRESEVSCCGIAGTYGYKSEKYAISMAIGAPLFEKARQFGGPLVVCDSETCRWQITHGAHLPAIHPVELLAAAYGYPPLDALAEILKGATEPTAFS